MDTYTVTRVTKTGKRLTGSPARTYRAANASGAGALYVAAEGIDGARFAGGDAGRFTFNPAADGAPVHVLVAPADAPAPIEAVEDTVSTREVCRCAGRDGSMYAKRDAFGFVEVFASNLDSERAAGTHLFKIVL